MAAGFANQLRAVPGRTRPAENHSRIDAKPLRLTVRRVKFACTVFVGALMLGVVSNAMLLQTARSPVNVASNATTGGARDEAAQPAPRAADAAPAPRSVADLGAPVARDVDSLPVGSIAPKARSPSRPRTKPRIAKAAVAKVAVAKVGVAKAHVVKTDGITAFLRDTRSAGAAHLVR